MDGDSAIRRVSLALCSQRAAARADDRFPEIRAERAIVGAELLDGSRQHADGGRAPAEELPDGEVHLGGCRARLLASEVAAHEQIAQLRSAGILREGPIDEEDERIATALRFERLPQPASERIPA